MSPEDRPPKRRFRAAYLDRYDQVADPPPPTAADRTLPQQRAAIHRWLDSIFYGVRWVATVVVTIRFYIAVLLLAIYALVWILERLSS